MNFSLKSIGNTSGMMRKVGLEADSGLRRVILLQGFATRSLQFNIFLTAIIWLYTAEASIMFSHHKNSPPLRTDNRGRLCKILCARFGHCFSLKIARLYHIRVLFENRSKQKPSLKKLGLCCKYCLVEVYSGSFSSSASSSAEKLPALKSPNTTR